LHFTVTIDILIFNFYNEFGDFIMHEDFNPGHVSAQQPGQGQGYRHYSYGPRTPQSVYGTQGYSAYYPVDPNLIGVIEEKAGIKKRAFIAGVCMLGYLLMQLVLVSIITEGSIWSFYQENYYFKSGTEIIYSIFALGLPFFSLYLFAKKRGIAKLDSFEKPKRAVYSVSMIFMGFGLCLLSSYIANFIYALFDSVGVILPYEDFTPPLTVGAIALLFVKTAIVPSFIEEFAVRGFLLQTIRKYGDGFAIIMSSLVFSLLHANAVQIPFAFLAGLALGYVYCKTNSIWTSVLVHFLNNALSCVELVIFAAMPREKAQAIDMGITAAIGITALISLLIVFLSKNFPLKKVQSHLEYKKKARVFITQPMFFIMALFYIGITVFEVIRANI